MTTQDFYTFSVPYFSNLLKNSMLASLVAQLVKNLPAMQKTLVRFLGQEDLLEKAVFWPEEAHRLYSPWGHRVGHN